MLLLAGIGLSAYELTPKDHTNCHQLRNKFLNVIQNNKTDTFLAILLRFYEKTYRCCGVNAPTDYNLTDYSAEELPKSCCPQPDGFVCEDDLPPCYLADAHKAGCWKRIYESNGNAKDFPFRLNLGVLIAQCLAAIQTMTLFKMEN